MLIERLLEQLSVAGLVMRDDSGARFQCASPELDKLCEALAIAAEQRPVALREAIASSPNDKLRNFADAFRFTPKDPSKDRDEKK